MLVLMLHLGMNEWINSMSRWQKEEHLQCQPAVVKLAVQNNIAGNGPGYYKIVFITGTTSNLEKQRTYNLKRAGCGCGCGCGCRKESNS